MPKPRHDVASLCAALEAIAPTSLAQSWDNVGLLAGDRSAAVKKVMLCIDLMPAVVDEAIRKRVDAVIAYHPPIFRPITRLTGPSSTMESQVLRCIERRIAIYSPHTAFDCMANGTNGVLAKHCDIIDPKPLEPAGPEHADDVGMGRIGAIANVTLGKLTAKLKRRTGARCVAIVGDKARVLRRAIVGVGAAGAMPFQVPLRRHDVIVTGEIRHHDALRIQRVGCAAIALSHWSSERPALAVLAADVEARLPGVQTLVSQNDAEPFVRA